MWPISKRGVAIAVAIAIGSGGAGCTASGDQVKPDELHFFFPTGTAVSPDGTKLFVANANSDLTYDSGTISVVDLASLEAVIGPWVAGGAAPAASCLDEQDEDRGHDCCSRDEDFTETLICDEDLFLAQTRGQGVRVGNFATDLAVQDLGGGALRLIAPTRGDPSIAWVDWLPAEERLSCNTSGKPFDLCDDPHRLSFAFNDADVASIPEEPFGVFADSAGQFAMVTHLTTGAVTLIDSPRGGNALVTDIQTGIFAADPTSGLRGATGIAGRNPRAPGDIVYVGSRTEDRVQTFTVGRLPPDPEGDRAPFLLSGNFFFLDGVGNNTNANSGGTDTRGMAFSPTGNRLYLVNRKPPSLQIFDTSFGPTDVPRNELVGAVDVCRQASTITVVDAGDGERAYVTCFQDGQVYVIDPRGHGRVEDIITVGRGPYAAAAVEGGKRLYVTNFLEDTISVVDLTPGSRTRNRVVLRVGEPRQL